MTTKTTTPRYTAIRDALRSLRTHVRELRDQQYSDNDATNLDSAVITLVAIENLLEIAARLSCPFVAD